MRTNQIKCFSLQPDKGGLANDALGFHASGAIVQVSELAGDLSVERLQLVLLESSCQTTNCKPFLRNQTELQVGPTRLNQGPRGL